LNWPTVDNYFNHFTEIEEHEHVQRGSTLLLSTLDWALIESWKDSGIPLDAVLRGIDATFERWERRPSKTRKVNGLAFCTQEVLAAAEDMKEAAVGATRSGSADAGLARNEVGEFLSRNAHELERLAGGGPSPGGASIPMPAVAALRDAAATLEKLAAACATNDNPERLEDLERRLTVMEEKLFAVLLAATPEEAILAVRAEAERDLAPFRRRMPAMQIDHLLKQYLHKRLLDRYGIPRLSLFYM